jgi:hypothetical protein
MGLVTTFMTAVAGAHPSATTLHESRDQPVKRAASAYPGRRCWIRNRIFYFDVKTMSVRAPQAAALLHTIANDQVYQKHHGRPAAKRSLLIGSACC